MEKSVQELKMIIRELILEVGELKERVANLEKNVSPPDEEARRPGPLEKILLEGESYEKLGKLYKEGYHVCPAAFGEIRNGECLFCIAFMEKE
ncbi:initiation control protein YabA [Thermosyntropha sp.]|uniref:initiation control protein YabA n=1 Tax=Thermosyntropha sp. TaxID=2740820 RepID=UPI0025DE872D|nr:initiation control protein YabA [Thermosyntropha sp.]MBO8159963.1 DUF972 family protein [Thermosyntropha sp.]